MHIMRRVLRSSANICPYVGQIACTAFTLQKNAIMHSSHEKTKGCSKKDTSGAFPSDYTLPEHMGDQNLTSYQVLRSLSSYVT